MQENLRDKFAEEAMKIILAEMTNSTSAVDAPDWIDRIANLSYAIADGMMRARNAEAKKSVPQEPTAQLPADPI